MFIEFVDYSSGVKAPPGKQHPVGGSQPKHKVSDREHPGCGRISDYDFTHPKETI